MESLTEIRDRLRASLPRGVADRVDELVAEPAKTEGDVDGNARSQPALVTENLETGKTYVTVPVETAALDHTTMTADDFLLRLSGRLVQAEKANGNRAFWTTQDLEFGLPSVATGPLNWLHQERKIIGVLSQAELIGAHREGASIEPAHIRAGAVLWAYLFPGEARVVEQAAEAQKLYYSMECVSREVACVGANGCGAQMPYLDALHKTEKACAHVRERASDRRFVDPIFQGAAVIVPPVKPGWKDAHVELMRDAEEQMRVRPEAAAFAGEDIEIAAGILQFVKEGAR